jgi:hypothetical protein
MATKTAKTTQAMQVVLEYWGKGIARVQFKGGTHHQMARAMYAAAADVHVAMEQGEAKGQFFGAFYVDAMGEALVYEEADGVGQVNAKTFAGTMLAAATKAGARY